MAKKPEFALVDAESKINDLTIERDNLKAQADLLQNRLKNAEMDSKDDKEALAKSLEELTKLEAEVQEAKSGEAANQIKIQAAEIATLKDKLSRLESVTNFDLDVLDDKFKGKEMEVSLIGGKLEAMETEMKLKQETIDALIKDLGEARKEAGEDRKKQYIAQQQLRMNEDVVMKRSENEVLRSKMQTEAVLKISTTKDEELGKLKGDGDALREENAKIQEDMRATEVKLREAETKGEGLASMLRTLLVSLKIEEDPEAEGSGDKIKTAAEELMRASGMGADKVLDLEKSVEELKKKGEEDTAKIEETTKALEKAKKEIGDKEGLLKSADEKIITFQQVEVVQRDEKIEELSKKRIPELEADLKTKTEDLEALQKKVIALDQANEGFGDTTDDLKAKLVEQEDYTKIVQQDLTRVTTERDELKTALEAKVAQAESLEQQLEATKEEGLAHAQKLNSVAEETETNDMKINLMKEQTELLVQKIKEGEEKIKGREELMRMVNKELSVARLELKERQNELMDVKQTLKETKEDMKLKDDVNASLSDKLDIAMMEMNSKHERLEYAHAQVEGSRAEIRALDLQLQLTHGKLTALTEAKNTADEQIQKLKREVSETAAEVAGKSQRIDSIGSELYASRETNRDLNVELQRLYEKLQTTEEAVRLREQQLVLMKHKFEFSQTEVAGVQTELAVSKRDVSDKDLELMATNGQVEPLKTALKDAREEVKAYKLKNKQVVLLNEKLRTSEAEMAEMRDQNTLATHKKEVADKECGNMRERVKMLETDNERKDTRIATMKKSLDTLNEEMVILKSSKELMAARGELQAEMEKQRETMRQQDEDAKAGALRRSSMGQSEQATMGIVSRMKGSFKNAFDGKISELKAAQQTALENEQRKQQFAMEELQMKDSLEKSTEIETLRKQLESARVEMKSQNDQLLMMGDKLSDMRTSMRTKDENAERIVHQYFHNTCLLVKMLLATRKKPENLLVQDLYEEIMEKEVPIEEWPMYVHLRMSGGEPIPGV